MTVIFVYILIYILSFLKSIVLVASALKSSHGEALIGIYRNNSSFIMNIHAPTTGWSVRYEVHELLGTCLYVCMYVCNAMYHAYCTYWVLLVLAHYLDNYRLSIKVPRSVITPYSLFAHSLTCELSPSLCSAPLQQ
jgi:hypothetical protein